MNLYKRVKLKMQSSKLGMRKGYHCKPMAREIEHMVNRRYMKVTFLSKMVYERVFKGYGLDLRAVPHPSYETLLSTPRVQPQSIESVTNKKKTKNRIIMKLIFSQL